MKDDADNGRRRFIISICSLLFIAILIVAFFNSSSRQRAFKDWQSEYGGGLNRIVNIYALDGTLIASHEGRIDIEDRENSILFDLDGKRYVYYNAIIEVIEK